MADSLRHKCWWKQYPIPSRSSLISDPPDDLHPVFQIGDLVKLKGKPDQVRKILQVEWHRFRHEYVYIIETSAVATFGYFSSPYWFALQLAPASKYYESNYRR